MLGEKLRPIIEPVTGGIGRGLARAGLTPNILTTIGLLGTIGCAWLIEANRPRAAGIALIGPMIVDVLDGATARATGRVTRWGAFYDSVCDRIGDGVLLAAIAWAATETNDGRIAALSLVALILSMSVPYARAKAEALGLETVSGPGERAERAVLLIVGLILGILEPVLWILVVLTAYTLASRCLAVWRQTKQ